jgi:hypothetical protein
MYIIQRIAYHCKHLIFLSILIHVISNYTIYIRINIKQSLKIIVLKQVYLIIYLLYNLLSNITIFKNYCSASIHKHNLSNLNYY